MFDNEDFKKLNDAEKTTFLVNYWSCIRSMYPEGFDLKKQREHLILRTTSIYGFNFLANNVYSWCVNEGLEPSETGSIMRFIGPLQDVDWSKKTSPFAFLGGGKGVRKAHEMLLSTSAKKGSLKPLLKFKTTIVSQKASLKLFKVFSYSMIRKIQV